MRTKKKQPSDCIPTFDSQKRILIVAAPYYDEIVSNLSEGAIKTLKQADTKIDYMKVPGALEIPPAIKLANQSKKFDGYLALGCVIRGETFHFEIVAQESSRGLMMLGVEGICIGNGILTVDNLDQAKKRAILDGENKGVDAAKALLTLIKIKETME